MALASVLFSRPQDLFAVGFESVCLINSDSPTVAGTSFAEAAQRTGESRAIGSCSVRPHDGGYYLIGLKQCIAACLRKSIGAPSVCSNKRRQRASELGLAVHQLPRASTWMMRSTLHQLCDATSDSERSSERCAKHDAFLERDHRSRRARSNLAGFCRAGAPSAADLRHPTRLPYEFSWSHGVCRQVLRSRTPRQSGAGYSRSLRPAKTAATTMECRNALWSPAAPA